MYIYGNQLLYGLKNPLINLLSKYHSFNFYLSTMPASPISSLEEIYCILVKLFASWKGMSVRDKKTQRQFELGNINLPNMTQETLPLS